MATQIIPENLNVTGARLPAQYEAARSALVACDRIDECKKWANKAQALASYARQADDDTLHRTAVRIQSRAIRRAGELLQELRAPGVRTDLPEPPAATGPRLAASSVRSATDAARDAGMSERQQKTAIRVANVPVAQFEAAIESDAPPTVTQLADLGKRSKARQDAPVPPGFQEQMELLGHARRLAEFAAKVAPEFVGPAVAEYNRRELRGHVTRCRRYLAAILPLIPEATDGI